MLFLHRIWQTGITERYFFFLIQPVNPLEEAAANFKSTIDECTAKMLNKLGIQFMESNEDKMVCFDTNL